MKQLHIISCVEDLPRFEWETIVQLHSARKHNLSDKFRIIVFLPAYKEMLGFNSRWDKIVKMFPETKFFFYRDVRNKVTDLMVNYDYIPIHRLCSLERHFKEHPSLEKDSILYIDSDVIFNKAPEISEECLQDDTNYLSDTHTYLNAEYLEGKWTDVIPEKQDKYKELDVFSKIAKLCNIFPDTIRENNKNTGGAQYLLKNMNSKFFSSCIDTCLMFRGFYQHVNQEFFPGTTRQQREDNGIQSWCADMIAIQWELWKQNRPSLTPKWMDFAWATDKVGKLDTVWMLHNAGVTSNASIRITEDLKSVKDENNKPIVIEAPALYKESYKRTSVFESIEDVEKVANHPESQKYCTSVYAQEVLETYNNLIKQKEHEQQV